MSEKRVSFATPLAAVVYPPPARPPYALPPLSAVAVALDASDGRGGCDAGSAGRFDADLRVSFELPAVHIHGVHDMASVARDARWSSSRRR